MAAQFHEKPIRAVRSAQLDEAHVGDIVGALGTIRKTEGQPSRWLRRMLALLAICGPGLIVMTRQASVAARSVDYPSRHREEEPIGGRATSRPSSG